jgi:hypothetical protein
MLSGQARFDLDEGQQTGSGPSGRYEQQARALQLLTLATGNLDIVLANLRAVARIMRDQYTVAFAKCDDFLLSVDDATVAQMSKLKLIDKLGDDISSFAAGDIHALDDLDAQQQR